jgi:hypothetical protein
VAPLVVIELAGPGAAMPHAEEMVSACTASLRRGECVLAPPETNDVPDAVAAVSAVSELRFEIRVVRTARGTTEARALVRLLEFRAVDAPDERWRSVGIAIASTSGELLGVEHAAPSSEIRRERPAPARPAELERPFRLAAGMGSGTGLESRRVRLGGWLEGSAQWGPGGPYALVLARYATAPGEHLPAGLGERTEVTPSWTTAGLGVGIAPVAVSGVGLRLHAAGLVERFTMTLADGEFVSSDDRWLPGALVAVEAAWPDTGLIGARLGGEFQSVTGATAVNVEGRTSASNPAQRLGFYFGLEVRP